MRPSSLESYAQALRTHVVPHLGRVPLASITAQQLQALYAALQRRGLSASTVTRIHAVVHRALKGAVEWNLILRNPADVARPPRRRTPEMRTLTAAQVDLLLDAAPAPEWRAFFSLAATTGLRRGEMLGLKWADVDLERSVLVVRRTAQRLRGQGIVFAEPKTSKGRRSVALTAKAVGDLKVHRSGQLLHRLAASVAWEDRDLVFANAFGGPVEETTVTRVFKRSLAIAGLPDVRVHDLRHSAATLLLSEGVHPKIVQEMLGHSAIAITLDTYSHVAPHMQAEAAAKLDALFQRGSA